MKKIVDSIISFLIRHIFIIIILLIVLVAVFIFTTLLNNHSYRSTIDYSSIKEIIDKKDDVIIYYYNSNSSNKNNKNIKKYLDSLGIRYYQYNDVYVDKEEYNKFLKLLNIDKDLFGTPAIIYIRDGMMYGNLIQIDNKEVVKTFIDNYDLYTVK